MVRQSNRYILKWGVTILLLFALSLTCFHFHQHTPDYTSYGIKLNKKEVCASCHFLSRIRYQAIQIACFIWHCILPLVLLLLGTRVFAFAGHELIRLLADRGPPDSFPCC